MTKLEQDEIATNLREILYAVKKLFEEGAKFETTSVEISYYRYMPGHGAQPITIKITF